MKKIKIVQIGVWHEHADGKITSLRKLPELFDVVGVVDDTDFAKTPRYIANGVNWKLYEGLPRLTLDEALCVPGLDAVAVEVPNNDLVPVALRCMERNLPMHMDKPGGEDPALFRRLREGCQARRLPFQMGYMFRGNPAIQFCQRAVRAGWLGEIFEIQASMNHNYGNPAYRAYLEGFPGGILYNLGCHLIDLIVSLLGAPENVVSFGRTGPETAGTVKNLGLAVLEYPHACATVRAFDRDPGGLSGRRFRVAGTKGCFELETIERFHVPFEAQLTLTEGNEAFSAGTHTVSAGITEDRYAAQLTEFARMVRGEIENPYSCEHDCLTHRVTLAAAGCLNWR